MCLLIEKARKDYDVVVTMRTLNDDLYLDVCCYHMQQAIEKLLKCSIELCGERYPFTHAITPLYDLYLKTGWAQLEDLELMAGTITDWESSSRYKESFYATVRQLDRAISIYHELEQRLAAFLAE